MMTDINLIEFYKNNGICKRMGWLENLLLSNKNSILELGEFILSNPRRNGNICYIWFLEKSVVLRIDRLGSKTTITRRDRDGKNGFVSNSLEEALQDVKFRFHE